MKKGQALEPVPETVDKADSLGDTKRFVLRFAAQSLIGFPQYPFPAQKGNFSCTLYTQNPLFAVAVFACPAHVRAGKLD